MQSITYTITTLAPVLIPGNLGDPNTVNTADRINGGAMLGVFAHHYLEKQPSRQADERFHQWFLSDLLKFTNAYIVNSITQKVHFPSPLSIQEEKYKEDITEVYGRKLIDLLFREEPMKTRTNVLKGFIWHDGGLVEQCSVKTSLNFHHQRNKATGTTEKGKIFNYESIDLGQQFSGNILGTESDLQKFFQFFEHEFVAYLGRSKHAQYGKVGIQLSAPKAFFSEINTLNVSSVQIENDVIALTLLSDLILYNEHGFSTTSIATLKTYLQSFLDCSIIKSFVKTGSVENFVSVWRLRKPSETCFKAGSTFLLKVLPTAQKDLLKLQQEGIGERRNEGFGRIVFGWQQEEYKFEKKKPDSQRPSPKKPDVPLPQIARDLVQSVIVQHLRQSVELNAIKEVETFKKPLPSKSLIARLEIMLKTSKRGDFPNKLEQLRKTAKDQLQTCHTGSKTLYDFLKTDPIDIEVIIRNKEKLSQLMDDVGFSFTEVAKNELAEELYRTYFMTFFALMRKKVNMQKGEA